MKKDKYSIRFLRIAEEDLIEIVSYIALDNPVAAEKLADKIEENILLLETNPFHGNKPRELEFRNFNYYYLIVDNYLIFYTIENKIVLIHRILHSARDYKSIL